MGSHMPPEERRTRPVEYTDDPIMDFRIAPEMPDADLPAVAPDAALPAGAEAPRKLLTPREAAQRMADIRDVDGSVARVAAAAAQVAAAVEGAQDEIDDATAARLAGRVFAPARHPDIGDEPVRPRNPDNLPDVLRGTVFDPNRRTERVPDDPEWLQVYQLPRYLQQGIRALGNSIFDTFPCFARHREDARAKGENALGSIEVLVSLQGGGPSRQSDLDRVAGWIRQNGVAVEASVLELPIAIPGYRPRIILSVSEERSYLMVDERRADGAPADAQYIYSWLGGQVHYLENPQDMERLGRTAGATRRLNGPARALPRPGVAAQRRIPQPDHVQPPPPPPPPLVEMERVDPTERKRRLAGLDVAPVAAGGFIADIRRQGFLPNGPQATPTFRKRLPDGGYADLIGQSGVIAADTREFDLRIMDAQGNEAWTGRVSSVEEVQEALVGISGVAPRR